MTRLSLAIPDTARPPRARVRLLARALAVSLAAAVAAGCTGDRPGPLGADLPPGPDFDRLLVKVQTGLPDAGLLHFTVSDTLPLLHQQVLFVGREGNERSSILVRYDLSRFRDAHWAGRLTYANIDSVNLRMYGLKYYRDLPRPGAAQDDTVRSPRLKTLRVLALAAPLDSLAYPNGSEPATLPVPLATSEEGSGQEFAFAFTSHGRATVANWLAEGDQASLQIDDDPTAPPPYNEPGIVGYASRDLYLFASLLDTLRENTLVGPVLHIHFLDPDTTVRVAPLVDLSSFSALESPGVAADGFFLRGHLRSDPLFSLALADSLKGTAINRALLTLTLDRDRSYGPSGALVCCEGTDVAAADTVLAITDLSAKFKAVEGQLGVDTNEKRRVRFDVTSVVQRWCNNVYVDAQTGRPQRLQFTILPAEKFLTGYITTSWGPEVLLWRYWFFGSGAVAEADRPQLEVYFTPRPAADGGRP